MNMIMWGDGENVSRGDGLGTKDITGANYPICWKKNLADFSKSAIW